MMPNSQALLVGAGALAAVAATFAVFLLARRGLRLVLSMDRARRTRAHEVAASGAQYGLLFFFWAVAAGLSAHGLVGFARHNMQLGGAWPYLLFFALDGAAAFVAVLLMRRAARAQSSLIYRLTVWGLVAASSAFNWAHAPSAPAAHEAFALMPVIAGVLFEFALHETRGLAADPQRRLGAIRWLHPIERLRVTMALAADETSTAAQATVRVRESLAARRMYELRRAMDANGWDFVVAPRRRRAERRAQAAVMRACGYDRDVAPRVLRQVQVLAQTRQLARLDYTTPSAARAALANLLDADVPSVQVTPQVMTQTGLSQMTRAMAQVTSGAATQVTRQVTAGAASGSPGKPGPRSRGKSGAKPRGGARRLTDEQLTEQLRVLLAEHYERGGGEIEVKPIAKRLGIGRDRARRLLDEMNVRPIRKAGA